VEPESVSHVAPIVSGSPASKFGPHALQILTTEHWSLLAARSLVYTEAMSRTSIFVAALTGSGVKPRRDSVNWCRGGRGRVRDLLRPAVTARRRRQPGQRSIRFL